MYLQSKAGGSKATVDSVRFHSPRVTLEQGACFHVTLCTQLASPNGFSEDFWGADFVFFVDSTSSDERLRLLAALRGNYNRDAELVLEGDLILMREFCFFEQND